jgi:hypothetical protein
VLLSPRPPVPNTAISINNTTTTTTTNTTTTNNTTTNTTTKTTTKTTTNNTNNTLVDRVTNHNSPDMGTAQTTVPTMMFRSPEIIDSVMPIQLAEMQRPVCPVEEVDG